MAASNQKLKDKAGELFTYFEFNKFSNELTHCPRINLVLEFCDYVNQLSDWELSDWLETGDISDVARFRQMINQGADIWLGDLIKTISF